MGQDQSVEYATGCLVYYPQHQVAYLTKRPPDITIDPSLVQYSGLDSTAVLQGYMASAFDVNRLPDYTEKLGSALGGLESVPNAVGLGCLVISMILELIVGKTNAISTGDMLRRVFAEEKASEIRDLMDEYMRRLSLNLRNSQLQLEDTRRIEAMLSTQLTRLKNSMVKDGHMSPRALNHWVNGAAFHTQMLIHQARLEGGDGSRAKAAVDLYRQDLDLLNNNYRNHVSDFSRPVQVNGQDISRLKCNMELEGPKKYFSEVQPNIDALVKQHNTFNVLVN